MATENRKGIRRRGDLLAFIQEYAEVYGMPPSVDEMAEYTGLVKSAVHHHLVVLRDRGLLKHYKGRARSWVVVSPDTPEF